MVIVEPDFEWLLIDTSHCKVHLYAAGAMGGHQGLSRTKGGPTQNTLDAHGMPIRAIITECTSDNSKKFSTIIDKFDA